MSYFIESYAGKKNVFTDALLDELIDSYSRLENLHAAFSGYYSAHPDDARENEALLASGQKSVFGPRSISGENGVNEVLPKQTAERFVQNAVTFKAVTLSGCGHWLLEECST